MPRTARDYGGTTGARLKAPEECVGYEVLDPLCRRVGSVEQVFVNGDGEPEYVRVDLGRFVRKRSVLLPVHLVEVDRELRTLKLA